MRLRVIVIIIILQLTLIVTAQDTDTDSGKLAIAVSLSEEQRYTIYVQDIDDSSSVVRLTDETEDNYSKLYFSPDCSQLAYANGLSVYISDIETEETRQVIASQLDSGFLSGWSPDGNYLTFIKNRLLTFYDVAADEFFERETSSAQGIRETSWSADGADLLYGNVDNDLTVYSLEDDSESAYDLTDGSPDYPVWSPTNPDMFAFIDTIPVDNVPPLTDLVIYNIRTKTLNRIQFPTTIFQYEWSFDGQSIIFLAAANNDAPLDGRRLYSVGTTESKPVLIEELDTQFYNDFAWESEEGILLLRGNDYDFNPGYVGIASYSDVYMTDPSLNVYEFDWCVPS